MPKRSVPYEPYLLEELNDDEYAVAFLNAALEAEDPREFLLAIKQIADAKGIGMTKLAKDTKLNREGLYKILSKQGNPEWMTLHTLLVALGFEIQITIAKPTHPKPSKKSKLALG